MSRQNAQEEMNLLTKLDMLKSRLDARTTLFASRLDTAANMTLLTDLSKQRNCPFGHPTQKTQVLSDF